MATLKTVRRSARHADGETALGSMTTKIKVTTASVSEESSAGSSITTQPAARGTYFRFLDLPPELRNRTYSFAFSSDQAQIRNLSNLKFPGITQANQQLRQECLAFLFAESSFVLYVGSNLKVRANARRNIKPRNTWAKKYNSISGTLGYKEVVHNFLKSAGDSAILRDVTFKIYDSSDITQARNADRQKNQATRTCEQRQRDNRCLTSLRFTIDPVLGESIALTEINELGHDRKDIEAALEDAAQVADDLADRPEFKGFSVVDLTKIARAFRFG